MLEQMLNRSVEPISGRNGVAVLPVIGNGGMGFFRRWKVRPEARLAAELVPLGGTLCERKSGGVFEQMLIDYVSAFAVCVWIYARQCVRLDPGG